MPRNYIDQNKIDLDFNFLNKTTENKSKYRELASAESSDIACQAKIILPPTYHFVRVDTDEHNFQLALLSDTTEEVVYYIKCIIFDDIHLNAKPVTQVLLWRTSVLSHRKITLGIAEDIFQNYLLDKYNIIASDSCQTREGRDFWVRQLGYAMALGEHVYRFNRLTCELKEILDHEVIRDNSADLWGNAPEYENILALISKDPLPIP